MDKYKGKLLVAELELGANEEEVPEEADGGIPEVSELFVLELGFDKGVEGEVEETEERGVKGDAEDAGDGPGEVPEDAEVGVLVTVAWAVVVGAD